MRDLSFHLTDSRVGCIIGEVPRGSRNSEPRGTQRARNGDPQAVVSKLPLAGSEGRSGVTRRQASRQRIEPSAEPEGFNGPEGEQRLEELVGLPGRGAGNGLRPVSFPSSGDRTEEGRL